jgi:hypothetical protein
LGSLFKKRKYLFINLNEKETKKIIDKKREEKKKRGYQNLYKKER